MATAAAGLYRLEHCCDRHDSALAVTYWALTHRWIQLCWHCSNQHHDALVMSGWVLEKRTDREPVRA